MHFAPDNSGAPAAKALCRRFHIDRALAHVALVSVAALARSHSRPLCPRRIEESALKSERPDNLALCKIVQSRAGKLFEQAAKGDETEIAVNNSLARLVFKRFVGDRRERAFAFTREEIKRAPGAQP